METIYAEFAEQKDENLKTAKQLGNLHLFGSVPSPYPIDSLPHEDACAKSDKIFLVLPRKDNLFFTISRF